MTFANTWTLGKLHTELVFTLSWKTLPELAKKARKYQTYTLHPTPSTLHPPPPTLHFTPYTLHPAPYTLHPTLYI